MKKGLYLTDSVDSYKVSHVPHLLKDVLEVFYYLEYNLLFDKSYIRLYSNIEHNLEYSKLTSNQTYLPAYYHKRLVNVIKHILPSRHCQIDLRLEKIFPDVKMQEYHNRNTRFQELKPNAEPYLDDKLITHPSHCWHFDSKNPENSYPFILYLSDVSEVGGGTCISDPAIRPIENLSNVDGVGISEEDINVDEIKYKNITGPAGTLISFNSYTLHRAGVPLDKPIMAMIFNFIPKEKPTIYSK